jgi:hypothetical protein
MIGCVALIDGICFTPPRWFIAPLAILLLQIKYMAQGVQNQGFLPSP